MNDYPKDANTLGRGQHTLQQHTAAAGCGVPIYAKDAYSQPQVMPARESELPEQLRRLENAVDMISGPIGELGAHLAPVLQPERESNSALAPSAPSPVTGYATSVYLQVLRIEHLCGRLQDILRRSEV